MTIVLSAPVSPYPKIFNTTKFLSKKKVNLLCSFSEHKNQFQPDWLAPFFGLNIIFWKTNYWKNKHTFERILRNNRHNCDIVKLLSTKNLWEYVKGNRANRFTLFKFFYHYCSSWCGHIIRRILLWVGRGDYGHEMIPIWWIYLWN